MHYQIHIELGLKVARFKTLRTYNKITMVRNGIIDWQFWST